MTLSRLWQDMGRILGLLALVGILSSCAQMRPDEELSAQELYDRAKASLDAKSYEFAIKRYEMLRINYPYGEYAQQGALDLSLAYIKSDQPASAILELEEFRQLYPRHPQIPYAIFLTAEARLAQAHSFWDGIFKDPAARDNEFMIKAYADFDRIVKFYPDSEYAPKAQEKIKMLYDTSARHHLGVANYYCKREAYLACANRAQIIVKDYPQSKVYQDALQLMLTSYTKLKMPEAQAQIQQKINALKG